MVQLSLILNISLILDTFLGSAHVFDIYKVPIHKASRKRIRNNCPMPLCNKDSKLLQYMPRFQPENIEKNAKISSM